MKQALVGVDVSHARQKSLVQQRGLDSQLSPVKQMRKRFRVDGKRFSSRASETRPLAQVAKLQPSESPRIYKTQLTSARKRQARVRVFCHRSIRRRHQQAPGHAQVHNPLRGNFVWFFRRAFCADTIARRSAQLQHDVLAGAMDGSDWPLAHSRRLSGRRCLEGFTMRAKPYFNYPVAAHTRIHTPRNCLYFGQFRHRLNSRACK